MEENKDTAAMQENADGTGQESGGDGNVEKRFTQEDVNRIVKERLAKEKGKGSEELDNRRTELDTRAAELDKRERLLTAREELKKNGFPDYLADLINTESEESIKTSIDLLTKWKGETEAELKPKVIGKLDIPGTVRGIDYGESGEIRAAFGLD